MSSLSSEDYALRATMAKLFKIHAATASDASKRALQSEIGFTGVTAMDNLSPEDKERYASLSKCGQSKFKLAIEMQHMRAQLALLEEMEDKNQTASSKGQPASYSRPEMARVTQDVRKRFQRLTELSKQLAKDAQKEGCVSEAKDVQTHVENTRKLYRKRFRPKDFALVQDDDDIQRLATRTDRTPLLTDADLAADYSGPIGHECRDTLRDDAEFQMFFQQTAQRDALMDKAIDRIYVATLRLKDNAMALSSELDVQRALLNETEQKTDKVNAALMTMNTKLKKTLEATKGDSVCVYLVCCVLLLAIFGAIYFQLK